MCNCERTVLIYIYRTSYRTIFYFIRYLNFYWYLSANGSSVMGCVSLQIKQYLLVVVAFSRLEVWGSECWKKVLPIVLKPIVLKPVVLPVACLAVDFPLVNISTSCCLHSKVGGAVSVLCVQCCTFVFCHHIAKSFVKTSCWAFSIRSSSKVLI